MSIRADNEILTDLDSSSLLGLKGEFLQTKLIVYSKVRIGVTPHIKVMP